MGHKTKLIYTKTSPIDKLIHVSPLLLQKRNTGTVKTRET